MQLSKDYLIEGEILKKGTIVEVIDMENSFKEKASPDADMMSFVKRSLKSMSIEDFAESFAVSMAMSFKRESATPSEDVDSFTESFNNQINYMKSKFSL